MWRKASVESGSALPPSPPALESIPQPKMAAGVDFGDLELFEAFDPLEESTPKPVHTRFKDAEEEEEDEDDENGVGDAELQEQLRRCEETIEQLRAENILPARWAPVTWDLGSVWWRARARARARRKFQEDQHSKSFLPRLGELAGRRLDPVALAAARPARNPFLVRTRQCRPACPPQLKAAFSGNSRTLTVTL